MSSKTFSRYNPHGTCAATGFAPGRTHRAAAGLASRWLATALLMGLALLSVSGRASAVEPWPRVDEPPKGSVQWVARSMLVNGVPTSVMQFQSPLTTAEIVDYYKSRWSSGYDHEPAIHHLGDTTIIGQLHGSYLMTVEVGEGARGTSRGLISVSQVLGVKVDRSPGVVPLIAGAQVVSVVESADLGQHSRQVLILASQSPAAVADFYQAALGNSGWQQLQSNESKAPDGAPAASGSFLVFSQDGTEIQLSIAGSQHGHGTSVLANVVTRPDGD
jgi:hypothetical protein